MDEDNVKDYVRNLEGLLDEKNKEIKELKETIQKMKLSVKNIIGYIIKEEIEDNLRISINQNKIHSQTEIDLIYGDNTICFDYFDN